MSLTREALLSGDLHEVLSVRVRGAWLRFSDVAGGIGNTDPSAGPATLAILPGFDGAGIVEELGDPGTDPGIRTASVEVLFTGPLGESWATISDDALEDLCEGEAEVSLVAAGTTWQQREVLIRGFVNAVEYGGSGETVTLQITQSLFEDTAAVPATGQQVTATTWPRSTSSGVECPEDALELFYPRVYGEPGASTGALGLPAIIVEVDTINRSNTAGSDPLVAILCGHDATCVGGSVTITNASDDTSTPVALAPTLTADNLGNPVVIVTIPNVASAGIDVAEGDQLWWSAASGSGGVRSQQSTGTMRGAGEIIVDLLSRSSVPLDVATSASLIADLDSVRLDFPLYDGQTSPWDVVVSEILPLVPAIIHYGEQGAWLTRWPWDARKEDARWTITATRDGPVKVDASAIVTTLRIDYAPDNESGAHLRHLVFAPVASTSDPYVQPHPLCAAAQSRRRARGSQVAAEFAITTEVLADDGSARGVLDMHAALKTRPLVTQDVRLPQEFQAMRIGDTARLTTDLWDDRHCVLVRYPRGRGEQTMTFRALGRWP